MKVRSIFVLIMIALMLSAKPAIAGPPASCTVEAKTNGDQTVNEATSVQLNGEPSSPQKKDGATFSWAQDPGDLYQVTLSDPTDSKPIFTAPNVGPAGATLHFTLTITGCTPTLTNSTTVKVIVQNLITNSAPVAKATATPDIVNENEQFILDGSGSTDPDNDPLSYSWSQVLDGGELLPLSNDATLTYTAPEVPYPNGATLRFRLTVSDGYLENSADTTVTVKWVNDPPGAIVSCTTPVNEGALVTLDGSLSTDDEDGIASYDWSQISGGPDSGLTSAILSNSFITFNAPYLTSPYDTMAFELKVTDNGGLFSQAKCAVQVLDITPPSIQCDVPNQTIWYGDNVTVNCAASDIASGLADTNDASFTLTTSVPGDTETDSASTDSKTVTDKRENAATAGPYSFKIDMKAPTVNCGKADDNWHATDQSVSCTATDGGSGPASQTVTLATSVAAGTETPDASTNSPSVCDVVDNCATAGPVTGFKIDKKAPSDITFIGSIEDGGNYYFGYVPSAPTCNATDNGSGFESCVVTGYDTSVGSHTLTATANDKVGNESTSTLSCTVLAWTLKGFYQPVDMPGQTIVYNTVKNGSTVPLKFEIFAGSTELTDTGSVKSLTYAPTACDANATSDEVETVATGGTVLRYDSTGGQFIYNWKTPNTAGKCYRVTMATLDGSSLIAYFKLK